jgi:hypothetical protein
MSGPASWCVCAGKNSGYSRGRGPAVWRKNRRQHELAGHEFSIVLADRFLDRAEARVLASMRRNPRFTEAK